MLDKTIRVVLVTLCSRFVEQIAGCFREEGFREILLAHDINELAQCLREQPDVVVIVGRVFLEAFGYDEVASVLALAPEANLVIFAHEMEHWDLKRRLVGACVLDFPENVADIPAQTLCALSNII